MKIIQVSSYYPPHLGGQENAVQGLARQLAKAGHDVTVLASAVASTPGVKREDGVKVHRLRGLVFGHAPIMPGFLPVLCRAVNSKTVVHLHIGQAFTPECVWLASKICHFKYIAELHIDFEPSGRAGFLLPLYKKLLLARVLRGAAAVIVLNEKTERIVREKYNFKGRLEVMNNGIEDVYFELKRNPFSTQPPSILHLLFVGRLSKQKNLPSLLSALKLTDRQVHVDIIGEGEQRRKIENAIADNHLTNVALHGRMAREAVLAFYASCDALIMPSLYEAQPLVLLEAMAARVPIIGANVIGVAEHIKDVGIIVEPTAIGLSDGIDQYYSQYKHLPQMVARGHRKAEMLSWPYTLKQYEKLYDEVSR